MGNSQIIQEKGNVPYDMLKGKEGYAVILGNELLPMTVDPETIGQKLSLLEESLSACRLHVMAPFLTRRDVYRAMFTSEEFKRICLMHFDRDMLHNLSGYSSYVIHYCGLCKEDGIFTRDSQCILYTDIIQSIYTRCSGKPMVFIFDCIFDTNVSLNVDEITRNLKHMLQNLPEHIFIFFNFQSSSTQIPAGLFTQELAKAIEEFSNFSSLQDMITVADLKFRLISSENSHHRKSLYINTMKRQLVFTTNLSISNDISTCGNYCCTTIKGQVTLPLPLPDAFPGCGRKIFIICAYPNEINLQWSPSWHLAKWLHVLGFDVYFDAPNDCEDKEWLTWYSAHIISCKNILYVCSPEVSEGFHSSTPKSRWAICDNLVSAIYQNLDKDIKDRLRFFPILIQPNKSECIPTLFAGAKPYYLTGSPPDEFDPKRLRNSYDELIFHISRLPLPSLPKVGPVQPLTDKKGSKSIVIGHDMIASLLQPQEGYVPVTHPTRIIQQPFIVPTTAINPSNPYNSQPPQPVYTSRPEHTPQQSNNSQAYNPQPPAQIVQLKFPTNSVSPSVFVWLAKKVVEWKFLGRSLGLEEYQLSRIEKDNPHSIAEQVIQTLFTWRDQSDSKNVTYDKLSKSLKYADGEKMYQEFVHYVNQHETDS